MARRAQLRNADKLHLGEQHNSLLSFVQGIKDRLDIDIKKSAQDDFGPRISVPALIKNNCSIRALNSQICLNPYCQSVVSQLSKSYGAIEPIPFSSPGSDDFPSCRIPKTSKVPKLISYQNGTQTNRSFGEGGAKRLSGGDKLKGNSTKLVKDHV